MKRNVVILCVALWSLLLMAETAMAQTQTITVGRGETFALIAKRYGMTVDELKQMNPSAIDGIVGMKLQVKQKKVEEQSAVMLTAEKKRFPSKTQAKREKSSNKAKKGTPPKGSLAFYSKMMEMEIEALTYLEKQKYSKAAKVYTDLIKMEPRADLYCERGRCYMLDKKYKAAIENLEQGLRMGNLTEKNLSDYNYLLTVSKERRQQQIESRNATWAGIGSALAVGVAVAGTAYASSQSGSGQSYANTYTSPVYTSSNATSQFGTRSDQILANANRTAQQIGQNAIAQSQQMSQRANQANREQMNWAINFKNKNGREPTEYEMDNWLRTNYPDLWQMKIQAASNTTSSSTHSSSVSTETEAKKSTKSTFTCAYCNGSGRILYDDDGGVPHFGLEMKYRGTCSECGAKLYEGYPHKHMQCNHCKGTGKQSY